MTGSPAQVILLSGLQGAGKSTMANALLALASRAEPPVRAVVISLDEVRNRYIQSLGISFHASFSAPYAEEVQRFFAADCEEKLHSGAELFIFDRTHLTQESRRASLQQAQFIPGGYHSAHIIELKISLEESLRRIRQRDDDLPPSLRRTIPELFVTSVHQSASPAHGADEGFQEVHNAATLRLDRLMNRLFPGRSIPLSRQSPPATGAYRPY